MSRSWISRGYEVQEPKVQELEVQELEMLELDRPGKKHFFVNSEILGILIWQKKPVSYDKF